MCVISVFVCLKCISLVCVCVLLIVILKVAGFAWKMLNFTKIFNSEADHRLELILFFDNWTYSTKISTFVIKCHELSQTNLYNWKWEPLLLPSYYLFNAKKSACTYIHIKTAPQLLTYTFTIHFHASHHILIFPLNKTTRQQCEEI